MPFFLYILGLLPSALWLLFYLRKDSHPESNWMIITTFFFGMFSAFYALILELAFRDLVGLLKIGGANFGLGNFSLTAFNKYDLLKYLLILFAGGALIEEFVKYLVVRLWALRAKEPDEPIDVMLYMIISALGFAALENILYLLSYNQLPTEILNGSFTALLAFKAMLWRFVSATFLHALCSGIFGYFLALSFYKARQRKMYFFAGLGLSMFLHGVYNWYIIVEGDIVILFSALIIFSIFVGLAFRSLKKMTSVCLLR